MTRQQRLHNADRPWKLREPTGTVETGCACPCCEESIASTHGPVVLPTRRLVDAGVRERLPADFVRACGWYCSDDRVLAVRDLEQPNSVWSMMTNSDERYVGLLVDRPEENDRILAAINRRDLPASILGELGRYCPDCEREYGALVTAARAPCRPCRGGDRYRRWSKPWDDGDIRRSPELVPAPEWDHRPRWRGVDWNR